MHSRFGLVAHREDEASCEEPSHCKLYMNVSADSVLKQWLQTYFEHWVEIFDLGHFERTTFKRRSQNSLCEIITGTFRFGGLMFNELLTKNKKKFPLSSAGVNISFALMCSYYSQCQTKLQ